MPTNRAPDVPARPPRATRLPHRFTSFTLNNDAHYRRTIRASGSDHGATARTWRMPMGSRTNLRHHQTLYAGRNLRSPRSHRQSRLAGADGGIGRPLIASTFLFANGARRGPLLGG